MPRVDGEQAKPAQTEKAMLRSLVIGACLASLAACATTPQSRTSAAANPAPNTGCLTTGSRIPLGAGECAGLGQSYSGDDLRQTGHVGDVGAALRFVDPGVVH
jgi:hypothetical protein